MKKYFIITGTLFLIIGMFMYCDAVEPELSGKVVDGVRVVNVTAMQYKFMPDPVVVKLGQKVRLIITSADVEHGLSIREFNVAAVIPVSKSVSVEFVPDKAGTFKMFCSVYCGPGHNMMQGNLIVKAN